MLKCWKLLHRSYSKSSGTHSFNGLNRWSRLFKLDSAEEAHPVVLPKTSNIAESVVIWVYETIGHGGKELALNNLRKNSFWESSIRIIYKCVTCRKLRGKFGDQKILDLSRGKMLWSNFIHTLWCGHVLVVHHQRERV